MATVVWLVRRTKFNGGRLGGVRVADDVAADLVRKGDALPFDSSLRRTLAERARAPAAEPAPADDTPADAAPARRRGRPPKGASEPAPLALADDPEPGADS